MAAYNDPNDFHQEAARSALLALQSFAPGEESLSDHIKRSVKRDLMALWRSNQRNAARDAGAENAARLNEVRLDGGLVTRDKPDDLNTPEISFDPEWVRAQLDTLPFEQGLAVDLYCCEGWTQEKIGVALGGITQQAVSQLIAAGLKKLRTQFSVV